MVLFYHTVKLSKGAPSRLQISKIIKIYLCICMYDIMFKIWIMWIVLAPLFVVLTLLGAPFEHCCGFFQIVKCSFCLLFFSVPMATNDLVIYACTLKNMQFLNFATFKKKPHKSVYITFLIWICTYIMIFSPHI